MTTFTTITNALVAVGAKPFASTVQALRDNPLAIAEGDPTAPKIQPQALRHRPIISGASAATQTFTGLDDYSGVEFEVFAVATGGTGGSIQFSFSTDGGATFSTVQALGSVSGGAAVGRAILRGYFDFATGDLKVVFANTDIGVVTRTAVAMAGASLSINAIRINTSGGSNLACIALAIPNGGAS